MIGRGWQCESSSKSTLPTCRRSGSRRSPRLDPNRRRRQLAACRSRGKARRDYDPVVRGIGATKNDASSSRMRFSVRRRARASQLIRRRHRLDGRHVDTAAARFCIGRELNRLRDAYFDGDMERTECQVRPAALAGELLTAASAVRPVPRCLPVAAYSNSRRQFDWSRPTGAASWSEPFWIVDRPEHRLPCQPFRSN